MKQYSITLLFSIIGISLIAQQEDYKYLKNKTYTYQEAQGIYITLAEKYEKARFYSIGVSDVGRNIDLFVISGDKNFNFQSIRAKNKGVLLINNAIHPGEPCGVDASIKLANDLLTNDKYAKLLEQTVVCIIPFYNVGGGLNRSCCSRANQNGPEEYGFRGNFKNRDLNRDFIKCDTKNAQVFTRIYHKVKPDVFIDTHTTNGSDFQYTMSLIASQPDKLNSYLRDYLRKEMLPFLYKDMAEKKKEIIPYVYNYKKTPDDGIKDYLDSPRYSTGFSALFNAFGFVTEALKYKPYKDRVEHTYEFLLTALKWMSQNHDEMKAVRSKADKAVVNQEKFELAWAHDTTSFEPIDFKGYKVAYVESQFGEEAKNQVYNQKKPYTKKINYYNRYVATEKVNKPFAYIIPQAYSDVINRFNWNEIKMEKLKNDTTMIVEMYYIKDYETVEKPYEGHYLHYNISVETREMQVKFYKGDYLVYVNQVGNRYIVETLEPKGMDSFFAWNFFDGILQQKEWFSPFSFEETAIDMLASDSSLKSAFEKKKKDDSEFAKNRNQQLFYIYKRSPYYENTHNRYPIARLIK
jgi:hypothetical protein